MRRSAFRLPETPDLTLTGTELELKALDRLQRYDVLPSNYVCAGMSRSNAQNIRSRIIHAQAVRIPEWARPWAIKRNVFYPLELTAIGEQVLRRHSRALPRHRGDDHFEHKYYRSTAEFLLDYGAELNGVGVEYLLDWLADDRCPSATRADKKAHHLPLPSGAFIVPDFSRTLTIPNASMNFHVENDRNTQPLTSAADRQNIALKLRHYDEYLGSGGPERRYGRKSISILWLTTTEHRKDRMLQLFAKSQFPKRHAIQVLPDFTIGFPAPSDVLVSQPWERAEGGPLDILKTLRETAERKSHGPTRPSRPDRGTEQRDTRQGSRA